MTGETTDQTRAPRHRPQHLGGQLDQAVHTLLDLAGALLRGIRPATLTRWSKPTAFGEPNPPDEVATAADIAVRDLILAGLREVLGTQPAIFAEEGHTTLDVLEQPVCVVLDPLDQPRALLAGRAEYSVNLAVIDHAEVAAWTDFPALGWRFHASSDGVWFNGRPLCPVPPWPGLLTVAVDAEDIGLLPARLPDGRTVVPAVGGGVAYRLALLALGLVQAVWIPPTATPRLRLWEVLPMAAALPHLRASARGWRGDEDLAGQRPAVWAGGLLAANDELRTALRAVLPEPQRRATP